MAIRLLVYLMILAAIFLFCRSHFTRELRWRLESRSLAARSLVSVSNRDRLIIRSLFLRLICA